MSAGDDGVWTPWTDGRATRVAPDRIVGSFPLSADYSADGWRCTAIAVDDDGVFVTATFEKLDAATQARPSWTVSRPVVRDWTEDWKPWALMSAMLLALLITLATVLL